MSVSNAAICAQTKQTILAFLRAHVKISRQYHKAQEDAPAPPSFKFLRNFSFPLDLQHPFHPLGLRSAIMAQSTTPQGCDARLRLDMDPVRYPPHLGITIEKGSSIEYGPKTQMELTYTANYKRYFLKARDASMGIQFELEASRPCTPQDLVHFLIGEGIEFKRAFAPKDAPGCEGHQTVLN